MARRDDRRLQSAPLGTGQNETGIVFDNNTGVALGSSGHRVDSSDTSDNAIVTRGSFLPMPIQEQALARTSARRLRTITSTCLAPKMETLRIRLGLQLLLRSLRTTGTWIQG